MKASVAESNRLEIAYDTVVNELLEKVVMVTSVGRMLEALTAVS